MTGCKEGSALESGSDTGESGTRTENPSQNGNGESSETSDVSETESGPSDTGSYVGNCADLETDSDAFCVLEEDGTVFLGKNIYEPFRPASITKVLTALVTLENVSPDNVVTVPERAVTEHLGILSSGVRPSFKPDETVTVRDLLYAMMLPSTNAAGNILAFHVAGGIEPFVALMNRKVKELGLSHSNFMNPHGMDEDGHYTCAYDMAVIEREAMKNETLRRVMGSSGYKIPATAYEAERNVYSTCGLINGNFRIEGVYAAKPGSTYLAKNSLVASVVRNGLTFHVCTLHSDEGYAQADMKNIIEYAYARKNGTMVNLTPFAHDVAIREIAGNGVTISYKIGFAVSSVRIVYWNLRYGTGAAVFHNACPDAHENTFFLNFAEKGAYTFQIFAKDYAGNEYPLVQSILFDGTEHAEGVAEWNGNRYLIDERGLLKTGIVETSYGCYGTNGDGSVCYGFVGNGFYAGSDGKLVSGWQTIRGETYYFQGDGRMATGKMMIGGVVHLFRDNGTMAE